MGYAFALLASALWGLTYALDEKALEGMSSIKLYFFHSIVGVAFSCIAWLISGSTLPSLFSIDQSTTNIKLLLVTLCVGTLAGMAIVSSIGSLGASKAAIIEISYPFFVAVFSYFLFQNAISLPTLLGGMMIFIGVSIIIIKN